MCGRRQDKKGVEAYLEKHGINAALQEAMTASVKAQCPNAKAHIGASLIGLSGLNVPGLVPALSPAGPPPHHPEHPEGAAQGARAALTPT